MLKIYNARRVQIGEELPVNPVSTGVYQYDLVLPDDAQGRIYYEFVGAVNSLPILGRGAVDIAWI